jgi:hypothetical protein
MAMNVIPTKITKEDFEEYILAFDRKATFIKDFKSS